MGKFKKKEMTEREKAAFIDKRKSQVAKWKAAKAYVAAHPDDVEKLMLAAAFTNDMQISPNNFICVYMQMQEMKLEGLPYIDTRTFQKWREVGRSVRRGETAQLFSITWIGREPGPNDDPDGDRRMWPKVTTLFHISQTEELEAKEEVPA